MKLYHFNFCTFLVFSRSIFPTFSEAGGENLHGQGRSAYRNSSEFTAPSQVSTVSCRGLYIIQDKILRLDTKRDECTLLFDEIYKIILVLHMIYSLADEVLLQ